MFSLREFLMMGFRSAIGRMADYQVILNAAGWQEKGVLTLEDLGQLQALIEAKNAPVETPVEAADENA